MSDAPAIAQPFPPVPILSFSPLHGANAPSLPAPVLPSRTLAWRLLDWSRQPGTQQGVSLLAAGCMLAALNPFPSAEGVGATLLAASLPKLWPDNTTDAIRTRALSIEIAHAVATRRPADMEQAAATTAAILLDAPR